MKTSRMLSAAGSLLRALAAFLACAVLLPPTPAVSAEAAEGPEGAEVQTRGPVHEAFAGIVTFNPEPGVVVNKPPPEPIEETPPDEKPEGENVTWIPGYWGWDDERKDYLWISGTWRALPPGRAWIAGYWAQSGQSYQWTSGYWADAAQQESTYLPAPPATVEAGPNVVAPSPDYIWIPGCWIWTYNRYSWRPGYWIVGRPDWDWIPAHYVWTPRGYILAGGYWDYPVERRGVLFAPVFFAPHFHARRHYFYSPSIVIDLGVFSDHLFCRPRYHHYYFGDYYAPAYVHSGFYASFSFHIGRHGYDPIYSHHRWHHRHERDWPHRLEVSYRHRRDHEDARPPRTWVQQRNVTVNNIRVENRVVVARTFDQYRKNADSPRRFRPVDRDEKQALVQRTREVQTSREERRTIEARSQDMPAAGARRTDTQPVRAQAPRSPIVSKPIRELAPKDAPPSPQRAPRSDGIAEPARDPAQVNRDQGRNRDRVRDQNESRKPGAVPAPRGATPPQDRQVPTRDPVQSAPLTPQPNRRVTPPQREERPSAVSPPQRTVPSRPAEPAPSTPQPDRRVVTPPQQPQRNSGPPARSPDRPVQAPPERRAPQLDRGAAPDSSRRATPSPAALPSQSQRPAQAEARRGPPQREMSPQRSEQKGAERLRPERRQER